MQNNEINMMIFWMCAGIGAVVYIVIIWSLVAYRKSRKKEASFHKNTATEIAWTVIPLLIIIAMMIPAAKLLTRIYSGENTSPEGLLINPAGQKVQQLAVYEGTMRQGTDITGSDLYQL